MLRSRKYPPCVCPNPSVEEGRVDVSVPLPAGEPSQNCASPHFAEFGYKEFHSADGEPELHGCFVVVRNLLDGTYVLPVSLVTGFVDVHPMQPGGASDRAAGLRAIAGWSDTSSRDARSRMAQQSDEGGGSLLRVVPPGPSAAV